MKVPAIVKQANVIAPEVGQDPGVKFLVRLDITDMIVKKPVRMRSLVSVIFIQLLKIFQYTT